jgi:hypothetical protein
VHLDAVGAGDHDRDGGLAAGGLRCIALVGARGRPEDDDREHRGHDRDGAASQR